MVVKAESSSGTSIRKITLSSSILPALVSSQKGNNAPITLNALPPFKNELFGNFKKKVIIAYLPAITLSIGLEAAIVSPKMIALRVKKEFLINLSAGTVYPVFKSLEMDGYIVRLPNKTNQIYRLTSEGRQSIEYFRTNLPLFNSVLCQVIKIDK